jgi:pimeloyl-ACP methyl ester carboxylesterase
MPSQNFPPYARIVDDFFDSWRPRRRWRSAGCGGRLGAEADRDPTGELTRDEILDNITLYWLTNTGVSASRLYWEYKGGFFNAKGVKIPVAMTIFPGEQYEAPRSWTERAYPKLIYYHQAAKGGHFAAWERPQIFAEELRATFKSVR